MPHVTVNGIGIEYEERGPRHGAPILLISGYTRQLDSWPDAFQNALVDAGYRVITFDNRDIGLSYQFDDAGLPDVAKVAAGLKDGTATSMVPYVLDDMASDAAALLKELDATPAIVMGVSMGGMIAQLVALNHPDVVKAIIPTMTTSGDLTLPPATPEARAVLTERPAVPTRANIVAAAIKSNRIVGSGPSLQATDEELAANSGASFDRAYRPGGIVRQYAAIVAQPRWHERLSGLNVPTLVLHGAVDALIPAPCGKDVADRIPGATYVEIPDWGHDMPPRAVPVLLSHILPFVNAL